MVKTYNTSKSNTSSEAHGGGGGGPDKAQGTDYSVVDESGSVRVNSDFGNGEALDKASRAVRKTEEYAGSGMGSHHPSHPGEEVVISDSGGGKGTEVNYQATVDPRLSRIELKSDERIYNDTEIPDIIEDELSRTAILSTNYKMVVMAVTLLTATGIGSDLYLTYNDAIDLNLEDHVTDADFALNDDKTEINGDIGFNIPKMGMFEKKILAQVHVTVLESNPTTDGDYSFEYTLGSGEHTYEFSLTDLDPVTVEKIDAGEDLELEYATSITVIYLGVELAPATTDMPAKTVVVSTT